MLKDFDIECQNVLTKYLNDFKLFFDYNGDIRMM